MGNKHTSLNCILNRGVLTSQVFCVLQYRGRDADSLFYQLGKCESYLNYIHIPLLSESPRT